ncbi:MAG: accessory gene regulator B family protein [Oscillospiraceae bacterium]|nr:accessory gene regulator B family protein [Oscillospiraceae bacterium]
MRSYAGGYHACSSRRCYVYSMLCITIVFHVFG